MWSAKWRPFCLGLNVLFKLWIIIQSAQHFMSLCTLLLYQTTHINIIISLLITITHLFLQKSRIQVPHDILIRNYA